MYRDFKQRRHIGAHGHPSSFLFAFWKIQSAFLAQSFKIKRSCGEPYLYDGDEELVLFESAEISFRIPAIGNFFPVKCSHESCLRTKQCFSSEVLLTIGNVLRKK